MTQRRRARRRWPALVLAMALAGAGCSPRDDGPGRAWADPGASAGLDVLPIGGDFTLTDTNGRSFSLIEQRGQAIVLFFGYTSCPDFCPAAMSKVRTAVAALGSQRERVLTVFISVDPGRDTPQVIAAYLRNFGLRAAGLTGSEEELQRVAERYAAYFEKAPTASAMGYMVSHTTRLYVIDPRGKVRKLVGPDDSADVLADALRRVLAESGPAGRSG